jgi:hypothetical protein
MNSIFIDNFHLNLFLSKKKGSYNSYFLFEYLKDDASDLFYAQLFLFFLLNEQKKNINYLNEYLNYFII